MTHRTKGTNSYLTRIIKKIPQISNFLHFILTSFFFNLELAKGRIIELKGLVFAGFLYKENKIISGNFRPLSFI